MAGLLITELRARGRLARCLVVAPGSLVDQWRAELATRFDLRFALSTGSEMRADSLWFEHNPLAVVRLDQCARDPRLIERITAIPWDLVVFDEAHRLSTSWNGARPDPTLRFEFAQKLAEKTRDLLLMSATPHDGSEEDFQAFLQLLDRDRFEGKYRPGVHFPKLDDLLVRRLKEDLKRFDGTALFPPRRAVTTYFNLSAAEQRLYDAVTSYVRTEYERAEALGGARKNTVGFALTVLQRRLASSPLAIHNSLKSRRERLEAKLTANRAASLTPDACDRSEDERESDLDLPDADAESEESAVADNATASRTPEELATEVKILGELEAAARMLLRAKEDRKREEVKQLLMAREMTGAKGRRRKLVVFTEHRDTMVYVTEFLRDFRGRAECVVTIDGTMDRPKRLRAQTDFAGRDEVEFLVATDAAGEGINLQCASLVLNWDLPWSPVRLEQRFGRVHRIGQSDPCQLWNLVAQGTREAAVFTALCRRLEDESRSLRGQVFDVLGAAFNDRPLRDFLLDAVRGKADGPISAAIERQVDQAMSRQQAFTRSTRDLAMPASEARDAHDRASAQRIGAASVEPFFHAAMRAFGRRATLGKPGRWKLKSIPGPWSARDASLGPTLACVGFDPSCVPPGEPDSVLLTAAHPWTRALAEAVMERVVNDVERPALQVDPFGAGAPWWLVAVSRTLRSAQGEALDEAAWCVAVTDEGAVRVLEGPAHLDLRAPTEAEREAVGALPEVVPAWLRAAIDHQVAEPWERAAREARAHQVNAVKREVQSRLSAETQHAHKLMTEAQARGERGARDVEKHKQRARELRSRLFERDMGFEAQRKMLAEPLRIERVVRVFPSGELMGGADHDRAVAAVLEAERVAGRVAHDVRSAGRGWDAEGHHRATGALRLWVVRAVAPETTEVTLRRTEAMALANAPGGVSLVLVEFDTDQTPGIPVELVGVCLDFPEFCECTARIIVA